MPAPLRIGLTLLLGAAGGVLFDWLRIPLGFLLGSLSVSACLGVAGFAVKLPDGIRQAGQVAAGLSVGLFFTLPVALRVVELGWLMMATGLASILTALLLARMSARFGGCDRRTAFFSALPGGLAEMAVLAHAFGANTTLVALAQSLRVVIIVVTIPPAVTLLSGGPAAAAALVPEIEAVALLAGLAAGLPLAIALRRLRLFNPFLLAGLAVGIATALLLARATQAPPLVTGAAQVAIGAALGVRFQRAALAQVIRTPFLPVAALGTLLLIAANVLFAALAMRFVPFPTGVLAMAPGGIAEMSLTAEALALAPPVVAAWQLVRILLVVLLTAPLYRLFDR